MAYRINLLAFSFAGCIVSVLLAIFLLLKFDSVFLAFLPTLLIPSLACFIGGLRHRDTLLMIAIFATIGWFAGTAFTPVVAMSRQSQIERNVKMPLAGHDPIIPCAILGSVFAFGRTCFVGSPKITTDDTIGIPPNNNQS